MNCDSFSRRMHQRLDQRQSLESDRELIDHARRCGACRSELDTWRQIASVMPATAAEPSEGSWRWDRGKIAVAISLAACFLIVLMIDRGGSDLDPATSTRELAIDRPENALAQANADVDPALWWRSVQDRDWLGQTMPTVNSVREGVAPIGRSLLRAVTILTGGIEQTS